MLQTKTFSNLTHVLIACFFVFAAVFSLSSQAHAKSPFSHQIAYCAEGLNPQKACKNDAGNATSWGPIIVQLSVSGGKFYAQQPCVPSKSLWPFKPRCINKSAWAYPKAVKDAVHPNTYSYYLRVPSSLDKLGKVVKVSGNYFPNNGVGCVYRNVRYKYCKTSFLVRIGR